MMVERVSDEPESHMDEPKQIALVAVDLDGTLLDDDKRMCTRAAVALRLLPGRGVRVVIASARPPRSVRPTYEALELDTWQINYNGAMIWDEPRRQVVHHTPLDGAVVRQIVNRARARFPGVLVSCEIMDRWFTDRADQTFTTATGRLFEPDAVAPIDEFCQGPITKLMLLGDEEIISDLAQLDYGQPGIGLLRAEPNLIQIIAADVSKATALRAAAAHYGVPLSRVLAIGDAINDIPMLQIAGAAVAMGNAAPLVKASAHWVAPSNAEFGVYAALAKFGLV